MAELEFPEPPTRLSISALMVRAQHLQLLGEEVAPELHSIAMTGSMLESFDPKRGKYVTDLQTQTVKRTREFGRLAVALSADLREASDGKDLTLAQVYDLAKMEPPGGDLVKYMDDGLVDLAASLLHDYGEWFADWDFGNPLKWPNWRTAAGVASLLVPVAIGGAAVVIILTGGVAALGAAPFIIVSTCTPIVSSALGLASQIPR